MIARRPEDRPRDAFAVHDALEAAVRKLEAPPAVASAARLAPEEDEAPVSSMEGPMSALIGDIEAQPLAALGERWNVTLAGLVDRIEAASRTRGPKDPGVKEAQALAEAAQGLLSSLDRAKASVAEHQGTVDALDARGRDFRGTLGHAIDALSRDRSREAEQLEGIDARREGIRAELAVAGPAQVDTLVWEAAALQAQEGRSRQIAADLAYQIETLQQQLDAQNEQLESELADATGMLEGALSGLRRITGELVRTMADAAGTIARRPS
jgi:hypothetical protein